MTYDRRGNGASPRPDGWTETSTEEQADDAASLLRALDLSPAAVFGTSSGAVFVLCLLVRHPEVVRGAILHEPALFALFVAVMAGESTNPAFVQASRRLAERLGVEVLSVAGAHAAYHDHTPELARAMRPFLREVGHPPA